MTKSPSPDHRATALPAGASAPDFNLPSAPDRTAKLSEFRGPHELFDQVDEAVESYVDLIAEHIVQLGGIAEGTARVAAACSRLVEYPLTIADGQAHVEAVSKALSDFGREARSTISEAEQLEDADAAEIFTEISRGIDKWLWPVEAHSQAPK